MVIQTCSHALDIEGVPTLLSEAQRREIENVITDMASEGLRTILLAFSDAYTVISKPPTEGMTCIGVFGIKDPIRPEVPEAVEECKKAGITVRMVTGDNILTAQHIARECGILESDSISIEGPKFRKMTPTEMNNIIPRLRVIARSSPEDKLILVNRLRENGEVVASTGDGTNDAPQLKAADVGFSMGIAGTEVAKDSSDIILLDDNFASIVKAVMWGRNVFDSIRKFLQFQLTVNVVAVTIAFIGAVSQGESPLSPVQMLWVNLIMDTMAALALATEPPTRELLSRPPHGRSTPLVSNKMWRMIIGQSVFQLVVLMILLYAYKSFGGILPRTDPTTFPTDAVPTFLTVQHTIIFNTFVFCQVFNELNCRKLGNELNIFSRFFANYIFIVIFFITIFVQILIVEFGGLFTQTTHLHFSEWLFCLIVGALSLPIGLLLRLIPVPPDPVYSHEYEELLLPEERAILKSGSKWNIVRNIVTELKVINALRRRRR
jgi:Ca2+-transporting ATPase